MPSALPRCTGPCRQGRAACTCPTGQLTPAEACTELGANLPPAGNPPIAYLLAPLIDRWPRFTGLAALILLLALMGIVGEPPEAMQPLAAPYLPGDGFPPELLAMQPTAAASEAAQ